MNETVKIRSIKKMEVQKKLQSALNKTEACKINTESAILYWPKKKQVVETTCESHEKTSMGNFLNSGEVAR